jgi:hypothetical protein
MPPAALPETFLLAGCVVEAVFAGAVAIAVPEVDKQVYTCILLKARNNLRNVICK